MNVLDTQTTTVSSHAVWLEAVPFKTEAIRSQNYHLVTPTLAPRSARSYDTHLVLSFLEVGMYERHVEICVQHLFKHILFVSTFAGDVENVSNYRPICSLPAMYKLFSTILYGRLYPMLDQNQAEDQAGFRKTYQTTDHLATYRMIEQKCQEWGIKMWTATVDFTKAFDSISHNSIWEALKSCNVDHEYVSLLRKIYKDQKASVQTDEESESFDIQKGSKQGDPMSSLLFNTVLQYCIKERNTTMAKEERNGNLLERPRTRLPNEPAISRRRDAVRNLQRTDTEYDVRIQESNRESGTQDPPRQDENSQQPKAT